MWRTSPQNARRSRGSTARRAACRLPRVDREAGRPNACRRGLAPHASLGAGRRGRGTTSAAARPAPASRAEEHFSCRLKSISIARCSGRATRAPFELTSPSIRTTRVMREALAALGVRSSRGVGRAHRRSRRQPREQVSNKKADLFLGNAGTAFSRHGSWHWPAATAAVGVPQMHSGPAISSMRLSGQAHRIPGRADLPSRRAAPASNATVHACARRIEPIPFHDADRARVDRQLAASRSKATSLSPSLHQTYAGS